MLPIRDLNPSHTTPVLTWLLVAACVGVFLLVQSDEVFFYEAASIPCEITTGEALTASEISGGPCNRADVASPAFPEKSLWWSVVLSLFLHGGLFHLISNMWVLVIFGNNVEDAFGHVSFLIFYLLAGLAASAAHFALRPESTVPVVGASGAIAGVMGAYAVLFPKARVTSIIPPFFFWPFALPALIFLLIWFGSQFLLVGDESLIAWEAHVAGFVFGFVAALVLRKRLRLHSTATQVNYPVGRLTR
ncbi:rhomboid family intramembrane serine protease [soil metagenome]